MSGLSDSRQLIADALTTVTDVTGSTRRSRTMNTGDAWPLIDFMERGPGLDFNTSWKIVVVLPKDEHSAMDWFERLLAAKTDSGEDKYEPITEALEQIGYVEGIEPGILDTEAGTRNIMILTLNKEA